MNKQTEALKMAIEALNQAAEWLAGDDKFDVYNIDKAYFACKEALEQPAQEPVMIEDCNAARQIKEWHEKNTHPAPSEPFIGGSVCPSCGNHSLFKTDKSEWCVTHKCLWQSDYPPSWQGLSDAEIYKQIEKASIPQYQGMDVTATNLITFARAIEQALKGKNHEQTD